MIYGGNMNDYERLMYLTGIKIIDICPYCSKDINIFMKDFDSVFINGPIYKCPHCNKEFYIETKLVRLENDFNRRSNDC